MNHCSAGHTHHDTKSVPTSEGDVVIFDWEKYQNFSGYCPGQDDVSKTLDMYGCWDKDQSLLLEKILSGNGKDGVFIDVGAHVGYFSRLALRKGYVVHSYEGEDDLVRLLKQNVQGAIVHQVWFDENMEPMKGPKLIKVKVMKIDIEGNERFAINHFRENIEAGNVENILMEVSPCFNDSYPQLIKELATLGYKVKDMLGNNFDFKYNFDQKDLWLHL